MKNDSFISIMTEAKSIADNNHDIINSARGERVPKKKMDENGSSINVHEQLRAFDLDNAVETMLIVDNESKNEEE
jgi:hypothetical protein